MQITAKQELPQEFIQDLQNFDSALKTNFKASLIKFETSEILTDDEDLEYFINTYYIQGPDNLVIPELQKFLNNYWDLNEIDGYSYGGTHPDGSLIKDNTIIMHIKFYI